MSSPNDEAAQAASAADTTERRENWTVVAWLAESELSNRPALEEYVATIPIHPGDHVQVQPVEYVRARNESHSPTGFHQTLFFRGADHRICGTATMVTSSPDLDRTFEQRLIALLVLIHASEPDQTSTYARMIELLDERTAEWIDGLWVNQYVGVFVTDPVLEAVLVQAGYVKVGTTDKATLMRKMFRPTV